jgi:hypothetical protein
MTKILEGGMLKMASSLAFSGAKFTFTWFGGVE